MSKASRDIDDARSKLLKKEKITWLKKQEQWYSYERHVETMSSKPQQASKSTTVVGNVSIPKKVQKKQVACYSALS